MSHYRVYILSLKLKMHTPLLDAASGKLAAVGKQVGLLEEWFHLNDEVAGDLTSLQRL